MKHSEASDHDGQGPCMGWRSIPSFSQSVHEIVVSGNARFIEEAH
jgi:hypothetical protein